MTHPPATSAGGGSALGPGRARAGPDDREVALLHELSGAAREMHRSLSLDEVIRVATERSREIIGARQAVTSETIDTDWTQKVSAVAVAAPESEVRRELVPPSGSAVYAEVCATNRPLRLSQQELGARLQAGQPGKPGERGRTPPRGWLAAPLVESDGRNTGLIQLADKIDGGEFTAGDEAILVQLAGLASVAMENARLYEAAVDTRTRLAWAAHIERVRAAELQAVIEAMGEAVVVSDGAGRVGLVNPAAEALFAGRPIQTYDDLLSRFEHRPGPALDPTTGPVEVRMRDQRGKWLELRVYPVRGTAGRTAGPDEPESRIAVMRDITTARQARAQHDAFLGILSHELRTPITTIYAGSKVLARDEPMDERTWRELASDISGEAERLFRLVEDLLVMTRVERGGLQPANEPVLLQRVLGAAIRLEKSHWPETRIRLTEPVDVPAVGGDATYVEQVARNLLSNAAKYSPPGETIDVRLGQEGDEVTVRVLDRGGGFASDEADDLFELFYRSPGTAAQASGAGIGLFVCRRLVTAMGGRIWARPRPGGGAEFGFALRRYREDY
ncbi:MAG TPA: ATP-binding protein [Candidatus Limnocylindrales bacterium]|nr:ATP-binding protein [Candidatus Limnocylindrales bacterium]